MSQVFIQQGVRSSAQLLFRVIDDGPDLSEHMFNKYYLFLFDVCRRATTGFRRKNI